MNIYEIAVIMTCFNRKEKTCSCLQSLFDAVDSYNSTKVEREIKLSVYLTDDGCTDGTATEVLKKFAKRRVNIIQGDGSLFWAGGMRLAWKKAFEKHHFWSFYLLLNDDTDLDIIAFNELIRTHDYCVEKFHKEGIYSGATCSIKNSNVITYGGDVWINKFLATRRRLTPCGIPQLCDMTNANILLISKVVVDRLGLFHEGYQHGLADYDYTIQARKKNIPVLLTAFVCGKCENDHDSKEDISSKILAMNIIERKKYFNHPINSNNDYLEFIRRNAIIRFPFVWLGRIMNIYIPELYYKIKKGIR